MRVSGSIINSYLQAEKKSAPAPKSADARAETLKTASDNSGSPRDTVEISAKAGAAGEQTQKAAPQSDKELAAQEIEKQNAEKLKQKQQDAKAQSYALLEQLEAANEKAKSISDTARMQSKCLLIASRIMAGDEVPRADHRFLAQNNSELYGKAITMRVNKENPKKYKRVSGGEDDDPANPIVIKSGGEQAQPPSEIAPPADAPSEPSSGGEAPAQNQS